MPGPDRLVSVGIGVFPFGEEPADVSPDGPLSKVTCR